MFRVVRLGGHKARSNVADAHDAAGVFMYRESSIAPLLDMRRRFKAVMAVVDFMIRDKASLARSVDLTVQWDKILAAGPLYPTNKQQPTAHSPQPTVHSHSPQSTVPQSHSPQPATSNNTMTDPLDVGTGAHSRVCVARCADK